MDDNKTADLIAGLRGLADFLEANPELNVYSYPTFHIPMETREQMAEIARKYKPLRKEYGTDRFHLHKDFAGGINL